MKSDRLVNLVQWFAAIAALIVVSRIAALVGLHRQGQIVTALVAATIPMLIDQASTLMTDGSAAFWVICVAWIVFRARVRRSSWSDWRLLGAALGLAALTKSSALIYSLPMVLWFAWFELRRLSAWVWLRRGLAMGVSQLLER
jgi:4-amino-4-deoxy-L-arabinose transferase-like glycosyltransferase